MNLLLSWPVRDSINDIKWWSFRSHLFSGATIISLCVRHRQLISVVRTKMIISLSVILNCGVPFLRRNVARIFFDRGPMHFIHAVWWPRHIFVRRVWTNFRRIGVPRWKIRTIFLQVQLHGRAESDPLSTRALYYLTREPPSRLLSATSWLGRRFITSLVRMIPGTSCP